MQIKTLILLGLVCLGAAGCTMTQDDSTTRAAPLDAAGLSRSRAEVAQGRADPVVVRPTLTDVMGEAMPISYRVRRIYVRVPTDLRVSEGNSYYPAADIVWHGDPYGNRYEQIKTVVADGLRAGIPLLDGEMAVDMDVEVRRFHALTERTRYTIGGKHEMVFAITLLNAETGLPMGPAREVKTNLNGLGGLAAVRAEAMGQTQKVRIKDHLSKFLTEYMRDPFPA